MFRIIGLNLHKIKDQSFNSHSTSNYALFAIHFMTNETSYNYIKNIKMQI